MKIPPPVKGRIAVLKNFSIRNARLDKLADKRVCLLFRNGWIALEGSTVLAAFYEDSLESLTGREAFARLAQLKERIEVCRYEKKYLETLLRIYPEILIGCEFDDLLLEARTLDVLDTIVGSQFFESPVSGVSTGSGAEQPAVEAVQPAVEVAQPADDVDSGDEQEELEKGGEWVMDLEDYVTKLKQYTGVVEAFDGAVKYVFWLKDGNIVAACMHDGGVEMKGVSVFYFANVPATVVKKPWSDPPEDAFCQESESSFRSLLTSLDRGAWL